MITPGDHPAQWTSCTEPVTQPLHELSLIDLAAAPGVLPNLAARIARSVLADPVQPIGDANPVLERLARVSPPAARLAVLDILNALSCAGAAVRPEVEASARRGLEEMAEVGPPLALRLHVGLAAIVYGEIDLAARLCPEVPTQFAADEEFPNDVLALLGYLTLAAHVGAAAQTLQTAWKRVADDLAELRASGQLDESAVLWLGRAIYQRFGNHSVRDVARLVRAHLDATAEPSPPAGEPEFPLSDTLGGGAFRIEQHLRGRGAQTLWTGRDVANGARVFVACDVHNPRKQDIASLRSVIDYQVPGLFQFAYLGTFDASGSDRRRNADRATHWAIVERVPSGSWLPQILGPADPWTAPDKAILLGRSAGQILMSAIAAGVNVAHIRPELMWAERRDGQLQVTGLSPRAAELFARKVGELVTHPVYDRFYHAPEIHRDPDDRAVAYSLAVMVAEWATGRYPFASRHAPDGVETARHEPINAPRALAKLLQSTLCHDRCERPRLAELVQGLEQL
jgi:hypothetical protein